MSTPTKVKHYSQEPTIAHQKSIDGILIDRDRLMNAPRGAVANACVRLFDRIQDLPHEHQLLAFAGAFVIMAEAYGFPAQDAFTAVKNLMLDPENATGWDHRFDAMRWNLRTEFKDGTGSAHYA